ncbi:MAG: hypothetical protein H0V70_01555 [Ktedonobacteraceae bacterium]|nr:hypothetical protein [Ktedonobacteraceae bacterium]
MTRSGNETSVQEIVENITTWEEYRNLETFVVGRSVSLEAYRTMDCKHCNETYNLPEFQAERAYVALAEQALAQVKTLEGRSTAFLHAQLEHAQRCIVSYTDLLQSGNARVIERQELLERSTFEKGALAEEISTILASRFQPAN